MDADKEKFAKSRERFRRNMRREQDNNIVRLMLGSTPPPNELHEPEIPLTPGRGWLSSESKAYQKSTETTSSHTPSAQSLPLSSSSITSPPPLLTVSSQTPSPPSTGIENPTFDQLPWAVQQSISEQMQANQGKRLRSMHLNGADGIESPLKQMELYRSPWPTLGLEPERGGQCDGKSQCHRFWPTQ